MKRSNGRTKSVTIGLIAALILLSIFYKLEAERCAIRYDQAIKMLQAADKTWADER